MRRLLAAIVTGVCGVMSVTGCTTVTQSFPGEAPAHVWTALIAIAESPQYDDPDPARRWFIRENDVWVDEAGSRIEIYRKLDRLLVRPGTKPQRQRQTWEFRILLDVVEGEPHAKFVSRGSAVPTHAQSEGERYFRDVRMLLSSGQIGAEPETQPAPADGGEAMPPEPESVPMIEIIDIENLEPDQP